MKPNPSRLAAALLLLALAAPTTPARADDGSMDGVGGNPQLLTEDASVSMVREDVTIDPITEKVSARFVFHNNGPARTVQMGFPETGYGDGIQLPHNSDMADFHSTVDGNPVTVKRVVDSHSDENYSIWWIKNVPFAAGQTRVVVDTYTGGGGGMSNGQNDFTYVLKTGASWKGPIGQATVTLDLSAIPYSSIQLTPNDYVRKGSRIVWYWSNFKPDRDIFVAWFPYYTNVTVDGHPVAPGAGSDNNTFTWPRKDWGNQSRRRGTDVWLPVKAASAWLGGHFHIESLGHQDKIVLGNHWAMATVGSAVLHTDSAPVTMPWPATLENGSVMTSLQTVVKALGGTYAYDATHDQVAVSLPHAP